MKSLIRWAIHNTPAMNTLMVGILLVGAISLANLHREVFPEFELEILLVTVPYPGASPEEVEEGICQKIEEAVRAIDGIKRINSVASEGSGAVILELQANVPDVQKVLNEVRSEIDRIPSFPVLAEAREVKQLTLRNVAIMVGVLGPETGEADEALKLRNLTEEIRDELLQLKPVSQASVLGAKAYQIDVEISERTLREYGLSLQRVAQTIRRENIELPGGRMKTDSQEVLLRGKNKQLTGEEIARIPLVTRSDGVVLTIGDLGTVHDEFADTTAVQRIDGHPGLVISINKTAAEDLLEITAAVLKYVDAKQFDMPDGYRLRTWADESVHVRDRMELLGRNGLQGLVLVFIVLAVFLELRLAFWVALGIPVSILGACGVMYYGGQTLNMLSMFSFIMALGILVDDAIVIGENIYTHRRRGVGFVRAAVDGTHEVLPSVIASVTTTIIAFSPLLFMPGIMGKFIAVMPLAVIAMLIISLIESTFILPCHLAHGKRGKSPRDGDTSAGWDSAAGRDTAAEPKGSNGSGRAALPPEDSDGKPEPRRQGPAVALPTVWTIGSLLLAGVLLVVLGWVEIMPLAPQLAAKMGKETADVSFAVKMAIWTIVSLIALIPLLGYPLRQVERLFHRLNVISSWVLDGVISYFYTPLLRWSIGNPALVLSGSVAVLLLTVGVYKGGFVPWILFPKLDSSSIEAAVTFPDGTPAAITNAATERIEAVIVEISRKYAAAHGGEELVEVRRRSVGDVGSGAVRLGNEPPSGSHTGKVFVELLPTEQRDVPSQEIVDQWRQGVEEIGIPGVETLVFGTRAHGPGGAPIEFRLLGVPRRMEAIEKAVQQCKAKLARYPGVIDIRDDSSPGKWEFQLTVKEQARAMGIPLETLAGTVRAAYYGEEVMRLQRGRHEVKLMVRYPAEERRSLANFDDIKVLTDDGAEYPLTELAHIDVRRGYNLINRLDQQRAITITADVDPERANAKQVVTQLKNEFIPQLLAQEEYRGVTVDWGGQQEQSDESISGLMVGLMIALVAMFALLTLEFRSYFQPLLILAIIPFGAVGAMVGHLVMGLDLTIFSLFGLVALTGVVVNDSIVLVDFINHRVRDGMPLGEALIEAGRRRFRPVLLTSLTTIAGLMPILLETSLQAQVLIPMAVSMCFGLAFATILVLVLVPTFYSLYYRWTRQSITPEKLTLEDEDKAELAPTDDRADAPDLGRLDPAGTT